MLPISRTTRLRLRPFTRLLHTSSRLRSSAEAAPAARPARFDPSHRVPAIDAVAARRAKAGKLVAGVAAASDSDMFKGSTAGKPKAKRWDNHLSRESASRGPCTLKQAARHMKKPGLISLGGGLPSSTVFPLSSLSFRAPTPPHFSEADTLSRGQTVTIGKYDVRDGVSEYDLSIALNYGQATGSPQMLRFLTEHAEIVHDPPYADWGVCQTIGSTGALEGALRMFMDKDRGDSILTEEFSFSTALETIHPLGVKAFGVPIDEEGLLPEAMDEMLAGWDEGVRGARKPHVLYTVPSGQNPTGATQGTQRRKELYAVAQRHDLYIIEDEPYYFIQMPPYVPPSSSSSSPPSPAKPQEPAPFLSSLIPSYLSLDIDGRVMRMDSFSKVLVPGARLGAITASAQVVERYVRHAEVASQGPSGFSQAVLHKLLDDVWGHQGYVAWLASLRDGYTEKRDALLGACEEHLPGGLVSWVPPVAGMFMWLQVDYTKHPRAAEKSILDIEEEIFNSCIESGVLVARGSWFLTEKDKPPPGLFFRATYASASPENMNEAIKRFGNAVRESFGKK